MGRGPQSATQRGMDQHLGRNTGFRLTSTREELRRIRTELERLRAAIGG